MFEPLVRPRSNINDVCFWHKADINDVRTNVRFRGNSEHRAPMT
jgi:hypothetical protein